MNPAMKQDKMDAVDYISYIINANRARAFLINAACGDELTFDRLDKTARAVAQDLAKRGLKKGDRVAIILENSISTALIYFGCLYLGVVTVPINLAFSQEDIDYILKHSGSALLILSESTLAKVNSETIIKNKTVKILTLKGVNQSEKYTDSNLEAWDIFNLPQGLQSQPMKNIEPEDILTTIYTSGTTARPKGVVHRIADLIDNARLFVKELGINENNRFYGILSMTYLGGYYNLLLLPFAAGSSVVLSRTFDAQSALEFWKSAKAYNVNTLWLVPSILSILMKIDRGSEGEEFCRKNVKLTLIGTAPLRVKLKNDFEKRYGVTLHENYGLSETLFIATNSPGVPKLDGCVGRVLAGVEVKIVNHDGQNVSLDQEGEILARTPYLMAGYYDAQTQKPDTLEASSFFPTGDIGILTRNNDLFITGRKKDLIIRGGINISPAAIEAVLNEHLMVEQGVVIGVPHEIYGEDIMAVVKLKKEYQFSNNLGDIKNYCNKRLGDVCKLGVILEIEEIPLGATGKILKRQIKEMVLKKLNIQAPSSFESKDHLSSLKRVRGGIVRGIKRAAPAVVKQIKKFSAGLISDCLNRSQAMDGRIRLLTPGRRLCGSAVTVDDASGGNLMSHAALELLQAGDVLVIDGKGVTTRSCWGGLQTKMAQMRRAAGIVIFGSVRDFNDIKKFKLPVYAMGSAPAGPMKEVGLGVNIPIVCGGVEVNPGDIIIGDDDGVVVMPQAKASEVIKLCEQRLAIEKEWFKRLDKGESTVDIVGLRDKINSLIDKRDKR